MKAKKVYEFQQGQDPYITMGLGFPVGLNPGDRIVSNYNLQCNDGINWHAVDQLENPFPNGIKINKPMEVVSVNITIRQAFSIQSKLDELGIQLIARERPGVDFWISNKQIKQYFKQI
jgi:hypothetical protein